MPRTAARPHCAIDFGTSNSAVALSAGPGAVRLVELEAGLATMPTAVFYANDPAAPFDDELRCYGRAAIAAYVEGLDGRLMRSMKSILGSNLIEHSTEVGTGITVRYRDVIAGYLRRLKRLAEAQQGGPQAGPQAVQINQVVLGRPVFFVDGEPQRDAAAQAALEAAARQAGFTDVQFQYEPIAAALDHEATLSAEQLVLVADIGGGTSDFSLVRVGPQRRRRPDRRGDILANHGVHIAGTDFDRRIELSSVMPLLGLGSRTPAQRGELAREVPSGFYFDLATWHLINTLYSPARQAELKALRSFYAEPHYHRRLASVVRQRLGHALAAAAESAKIELAGAGRAHIDLGAIEPGLGVDVSEAQAAASIEADLDRIVRAASDTLALAGARPEQVDVLYCTGGSTGLSPLVQRMAAGLPRAQVQRGDRFASVARGLGLHAQTIYGT